MSLPHRERFVPVATGTLLVMFAEVYAMSNMNEVARLRLFGGLTIVVVVVRVKKNWRLAFFLTRSRASGRGAGRSRGGWAAITAVVALVSALLGLVLK